MANIIVLRDREMLMSHLLHSGIEPYPGCRLRQLLSRSGRTEVWEAQMGEERPVAVKFVPSTDRALQRDLPFLLAIRHLSHPHLIPIYWVWCYRNYIVAAMELARGSLLDLHAASYAEFGKPMTGRQVCRYLTLTAHALDFLNSREHRLCGQRVFLQHGNIKPSNLLLVGNTLKLTDFKLSSHERLAETHRYTPPEALNGRGNDRSDQYSLAVTYCYLRGGCLPNSDRNETMSNNNGRPEPDLTILPKVEQPIIVRALAPEPEDRWSSCTKLMAQLTNVVT